MKKLLSVVLAVLMLISLTACNGSLGGDDAEADASKNKVESNEGQSTGKIVVGVCQLVPHVALDAATQGFVDTLYAEFGEENIDIVVKDASGDVATCAQIVNTFVSDDVDLIMANATPALQSAAAATGDIPILGTSVTEYGVALDIQDFSGTVGGNVSGTSDLAPLDEQAAMVKEWFPNAKNVGLIYCAAEANSQYQVDTVQTELEALGYTCTQYAFSDSNDMQAIAQKAADESDVIYVPTDNTVASSANILNEVCVAAGVPVIAGEEGICAGCGIATLSISYYDLGVKTGQMAIQILKGEADISTMAVAYADTFTKKYNAAACEALGIEPLEGYVAIEG